MITIFHPACTHRLARKNILPTSIITPQKICSPVKSPPSFTNKAPAIGLPVNPAKETIRNRVPVLTPISRTSEIWATRDGAKETKAPDVNPYSAPKMTMGMVPRDGSQSARTRMPEAMVVTIIKLKRP